MFSGTRSIRECSAVEDTVIYYIRNLKRRLKSSLDTTASIPLLAPAANGTLVSGRVASLHYHLFHLFPIQEARRGG